jgi:hypothetical protein
MFNLGFTVYASGSGTMPTAVASALASGLTSWVDGAQGQLVAILPIALGLVITIAVVFFAINFFRAIVHI